MIVVGITCGRFTCTLALVLLRCLWPRLVYGSMHLFFSLLTMFALLELLLLFLNVLLGDLIVLVLYSCCVSDRVVFVLYSLCDHARVVLVLCCACVVLALVLRL